MNLNQIVWLDFDYMNKHYEGEAMPSFSTPNSSIPPAFDIYFENEYSGTIVKENNDWVSDNRIEDGLVRIITRKLSSLFNS